MEYLLSKVTKSSAKTTKSSDMGLRFLHELCFSPTLLNGGLGCPSQLKEINDLYRTYKKDQSDENLDQEPEAKRPGSTRVMSPDEARHFLSALEEQSKTIGSDFVSDQRFGRGQGASRRNHAMDSIDEQIADAKQIIAQSTRKAATLRGRRAKARWHVALELVTTGKLRPIDIPGGVSSRMVDLWRWRGQCISEGLVYGTRGWRPSSSFARDLLVTRPTFVWLNPYCYHLAGIPGNISLDEVRLKTFESIKATPRLQSKLNALRKRLEKNHINEDIRQIESAIASVEQSLETARAADQLLEQPVVTAIGSQLQRSQGGDWGAFVHVTSEEPFSLLEKSSKLKQGIPIARPEMVPRTLAVLKTASEAYETAVAEYNVHPCADTTARRSDALKVFEAAKLGLTIRHDSHSLVDATCVVMSKATTAFRDHKPKTASALIDRVDVCILQSNRDLETALARLKQAEKDVNRFVFSKKRDVKLMQRSGEFIVSLFVRSAFPDYEYFCFAQPTMYWIC